MSQFYDQASLVMVPSGYKNGKLYSQKPLSTSGELSFSRASNATRVNSSGLVEKVRTNLALYSQDFSQTGTWSPRNGTFTANAGTAPDGTNTATKLTSTDTDPYVYQSINTAGLVTASCYVKAIGSSIGKNAQIRISPATIDVAMTGEWQRISVTTTTIGATNCGIEVPSVATIGDEVLIWGFQMEYGDIATDYIATTSAAVSVGPVSGLPRLDYSGGCPSLLLEPQRTNNALYSEQADNSWWLKHQCSITANQAVSPDGYTNADLLTMTANGTGVIYRIGFTTGALSFFAKTATLSTGTKFSISVDGVGNATWNQDGTLNAVSGGTATDGVSYGNGWYRFNYNVTSGSVINYGLSSATSGDTAYIWGIQNEASAAYATSYIPTLSSAVTRVGDACYKTGISSLIGQTEGTFFVDIDYTQNSDYNVLIETNDGSTNNRAVVFFGTGNDLNVSIGVMNFSYTMPSNGHYKIAFAYKSGDSALYVNGANVANSTTAFSVSTMSNLNIANNVFGGQISNNPTRQALLFKTRLSNADLATLTTL